MIQRPTQAFNLDIRERIKAIMLLKRLQAFALDNPDNPKSVRMTRSQVHTALALLRKVLPDLASVEVTGNAEKPLMVQVVRFSDGATTAPMAVEARNMLDMGRLVELDADYRVNGSDGDDGATPALPQNAKPRKNGRNTGGSAA